MKIKSQNQVLYREVQRPPQLVLGIIILVLVGFFWYGFIQQVILGIPLGSKPASDLELTLLWVIFGIVTPIIAIWLFKLIIEVREDGLYIRFMPFHLRFKQFLFRDIKHYESITYSSFMRFGGWGIRMNFSGETAYNMNGNKGIELKLKNNQVVVIGTQQPNELKEALDSLEKPNPF